MHTKIVILLVFLFSFYVSTSLKAQQSNAGIFFQAIARDHANNPLNNRNIYVKATILNNSTDGLVLHAESHQVQTDPTGVFNIAIGKGIYLDGLNKNIKDIDWASGIHYLNLKISITPISPSLQWDYNKEWIDLGTTIFGVVPYAFNLIGEQKSSFDTTFISNQVKAKLNLSDTATMLLSYAKKGNYADANLINFAIDKKLDKADSTKSYVTPSQLQSISFDTVSLSERIEKSLKLADTIYLSERINDRLKLKDTVYLSQRINERLKITDTVSISNRINNNLLSRDTIFLSDRIDLKESLSNKSVNLNLLQDYNNQKYPSVKATKDYIDGALIAGAPDANINTKGILKLDGDLTGTALLPTIANNAITTSKILDGAITDAKIATGIHPAKVGLENVTNHAQLYSFNGLTGQVQTLANPGNTGLLPNWSSVGTTHTLNIPLASAGSVTAGLISKSDYDHFQSAYTNNLNAITTTGNSGAASVSAQTINIPNYTIAGLAGNTNANAVFAGPSSGGVGAASFRNLVSADIPNHASNTSGNAATATKFASSININGIPFDGATDIVIQANTNNQIGFSDDGLGMSPGGSFNGALAKQVSYNTIGAAPANGSSSITTLGSINTGTWAANIIGANYGGAGSNLGLLKANGSGIVSAAVSGTDYLPPFGSQTAKQFYAAPNLANGNPIFRSIVASDLPILNQNTSGNAATATAFETARNINGISFAGTSDITISANTTNAITFNNNGSGSTSGTSFNGASASTISYNTIGAAPAIGSSNLTTLGTIVTGTWSATVIGQDHGGAGNINGILKADGTGKVDQAIAGTDYQLPLTFSSPLSINSTTVSIPQANNINSGYLSTSDWSNFNNKINSNLLGVQNGVATLDGLGKIPTSQIPAISFASGYVVNNQSQMLALSTAVVGSIAIRTDNSKNYVLSANDPSVLANWLELLMPAAISSVNGLTTGSITLSTFNIGENTNLYFTEARARSAISAASPLSYSSVNGVMSLPAATISNGGYLTATDWNTFNSKLGAFASQTANSFFAGPSSGANASPTFRTIVANDIPTLNQSTTGNAATATKLAATKNINGVAFDGSADITIASAIANAISFNASGSGQASPVSFDGTAAKTISYNSIGAAPAAGSSNITNLGTISTGVWEGSIIDANHGGAGMVNGMMKANGSGVVAAAIAGVDYVTPFTSQTSKYFYAAPSASNGVPVFRTIMAADIPLLNQNTTGNAATSTSLLNARSINGVSFNGTADITIPASTTNTITFNSSGTGAASSANFNGSSALVISYNSIGALPTIGATSITTLGTIGSGTWNANVIGSSYGGAGAVNGILKANGSGLVAAAIAGTDYESPLTFSSPIARSTNTISIPVATTNANGYLSSTDWNIFNSKQATIIAGTGVTIQTGNTIQIGQEVSTTSSPIFAAVTSNSDVTAKRYKLTMPTATDASTTSTSVDLSTGNVFTINLKTATTSVVFTNAAVGTYLIKLLQDATGGREATFTSNTNLKWAGGIAPTMTDAGGKLDIVTLIYDGTNYYATIVKNF